MIEQAEGLWVGVGLPWARIFDRLPLVREGLLSAVANQYDTCEVLMLTWMNRKAPTETPKTGQVCYWSRSRVCFWDKGDAGSGAVDRSHRPWREQSRPLPLTLDRL
jgi:phosphoribosyl-AMP cyclohydrolase